MSYLSNLRDDVERDIVRAEGEVENGVSDFESGINRKWALFVRHFDPENYDDNNLQLFEDFCNECYTDTINAVLDAVEEYGISSSTVEGDITSDFEEALDRLNTDIGSYISWYYSY